MPLNEFPWPHLGKTKICGRKSGPRHITAGAPLLIYSLRRKKKFCSSLYQSVSFSTKCLLFAFSIYWLGFYSTDFFNVLYYVCWYTSYMAHTNQGVTQAQSPFCSFLRTGFVHTHQWNMCKMYIFYNIVAWECTIEHFSFIHRYGQISYVW